jgi:hypothetical protein
LVEEVSRFPWDAFADGRQYRLLAIGVATLAGTNARLIVLTIATATATAWETRAGSVEPKIPKLKAPTSRSFWSTGEPVERALTAVI